MTTIETSKLFTGIKAEGGLDVYLLEERVAPLQKGFYYINNSWTNNGRYLWFICAYPPSPNFILGLIDFENDSVRVFPETQHTDAAPWVDPESGEVYWAIRNEVWCLDPATGNTRYVNCVPQELIGSRAVPRSVTHLTCSPNGKEFFIDAKVGDHFLFGTLPLDGGAFEFWHRFDRNYNHAQFSPVDNDLILFSQENHPDPLTGLSFPIVDRMWLLRRGGKPTPVFAEAYKCTHEWWDHDGEHVWYIQGKETSRINIHTKKVDAIEWPHPTWHATNSRDGKYLVCDSTDRFYRGCPSRVTFYNCETKKFIPIIKNPEMNRIDGKYYHIDPHPRFCCNDRYIVMTVTVRDKVDLAVIKTEDLIKLSS